MLYISNNHHNCILNITFYYSPRLLAASFWTIDQKYPNFSVNLYTVPDQRKFKLTKKAYEVIMRLRLKDSTY